MQAETMRGSGMTLALVAAIFIAGGCADPADPIDPIARCTAILEERSQHDMASPGWDAAMDDWRTLFEGPDGDVMDCDDIEQPRADWTGIKWRTPALRGLICDDALRFGIIEDESAC